MQVEYWNNNYQNKRFSHPIDNIVYSLVDKDSQILDYGCGTGRVIDELLSHGIRNIIGVDSSNSMIVDAAAKIGKNVSTVQLMNNKNIKIPMVKDCSIDLAMLIAVLTCTPYSIKQKNILDELARVIKPGRYLYVSDYLLQHDARNISRYDLYQKLGYDYGTFLTDDNGIMRHHTLEYLLNLFDKHFSVVWSKLVNATTMNGNKTQIYQVLLRKYENRS